MKEILKWDRVGVTINEFHEAILSEGLYGLLAISDDKETLHCCRVLPERHFSLEAAGKAHEALYRTGTILRNLRLRLENGQCSWLTRSQRS